MKIFSRLCCLLLLSAGVIGNEPEVNGGNLYQEHCEQCHGYNGYSDVSMVDFRRGEGLFLTDANLIQRIKDGGRICPSFEHILQDSELTKLVFFLRANF